MSNSGVGGMTNLVGACTEARELSRRRVTPLTPVTPVTPVVPTTPMLMAHIFAEGNIMEDLQLAAELGKTLLERNRELESQIKYLQTINDDQTQEIEYLSKQTAALREVNDSRLRIYEQLEISIQDLEKTNQRLTAEHLADKRKIKSLISVTEQLESKCDDLQKSLEDTTLAHLLEEQQRGRALTKKSHLIEEPCYRRSISCENSLQISEELLNEFTDLKLKYENCQQKVNILQAERFDEDKRKEDLEIELSCVAQENTVLLEQLAILKEKQINVRCFEDELASLDDTTSSRLCRKCMGLTDDTASNLTMQDNEELEDFEFDRLPGECEVIKFKNGGYACGSQESLASMGQALSYGNSIDGSPKVEIMEAPNNSLLSELDTQYRILIEKYEALLESKERSNHQVVPCEEVHREVFINDSGPMGLILTDSPQKHNGISMRCQRCTTCTCDLKPSDPRPKSNLEEYSEVETSSSGFSEGESRVACKCVQTEPIFEEKLMYGDDAITPVALQPLKCLDLSSPLNPCEKRFQNTPQYKTLFKDIFDVLKKNVDENEAKKAFTRTIMQSQQLVIMSHENYPRRDSSSKAVVSNNQIESDFRDDNEENRNPNKMVIKQMSSSKKQTIDQLRIETPVRPDSLDLDNDGTGSGRSSGCRSRRRKRRQRHDSQRSDINLVPYNGNESSHHLDSSSKTLRDSSTNEVADRSKISSSSSTAVAVAADATGDGGRDDSSEVHVSKARCKHKHRNRRLRPLASKLLEKLVEKQNEPCPVLLPCVDSKKLAFSHPSVEVAKLRRLEMTYAEVLKKRRNKDRRY